MSPTHLLRLLGGGLFVTLTLGCSGALEPWLSDDEPATEAPAEDDRARKRGKRKNQSNRPFDPQPVPDQADAPDATQPTPEGTSTGSPSAPTPRPAPGAAPAPSSPTPAGITKTSDTTWTIQRSLVDGWTNNPSKLGSVRSRKLGYQLQSVSSSSDLWHIGLRTGDIIKKVNEHALTSETAALQAYMALQSADKLTVRLKRGDSHRVHTYTVQD